MKKFKSFNFWIGLFLTAIAFLLGGYGDVCMAADGDLEDGGTQRSGAGNIGGQTTDSSGAHVTDPIVQETGGIATETGGRESGDPDFYLNDVDRRIVKIRPLSTPVDQISRYASTSHTDSFICKYYSVGTRPIVAELTESTQAMASNKTTIAISVEDPSMFSVDDTIRVVGVKAKYLKKEGAPCVAYAQDSDTTPDLVLVVTGINDNGQILVYAMNGDVPSVNNEPQLDKQPILVPALDHTAVKLIRMGKSCGEVDAQTGRFESTPTAEVQYCQNFMMQVEQSFLDKMAAKEVNWGFDDLEEDAIYDMRLTMEQSFLFGSLGYIRHNSKANMAQWFTKGIWWMAGKTVDIGSVDKNGEVQITDDDLVNFASKIFTGSGSGNKKKILLCGSNLLAAFDKIKSEKYKLITSMEKWNLKFTAWETGFGTLNLIHHELFDINDMSDKGFVLDPEFLRKRKHLDWNRMLLDLKKSGIRNTQAAVIQEISCLYLRYPNAHARVSLIEPSVPEDNNDDNEGNEQQDVENNG